MSVSGQDVSLYKSLLVPQILKGFYFVTTTNLFNYLWYLLRYQATTTGAIAISNCNRYFKMRVNKVKMYHHLYFEIVFKNNK